MNTRRHALLIGIDRYPQLESSLCENHAPRIAGAINDMQRFYGLLAKQGFDVRLLLQGRATRKRIVLAMDDLVERISPGDRLVVAFSGLGSKVRAQGPNNGGWTNALRSVLPSDSGRHRPDEETGQAFSTTGPANRDIFEAEWLDWLDRLSSKAPRARITLIFDTCFCTPSTPATGGTVRSVLEDRRAESELLENLRLDESVVGRFPRVELIRSALAQRLMLGSDAKRETPWLVEAPRGCQVLNACPPGKFSSEFDQDGLISGLFSHHLLSVLENTLAQGIRWHALDWSQLAERTATAMRRISGQQPSFSGRRPQRPPALPEPVSPGDSTTITRADRGKMRRALVVGINRYRHFENVSRRDLQACVHDAQAMLDIFRERQFDVQLLLDQRATRANIMAAMQSLVDSAQTGDSIALYYSGHGSFIEAVDWRGKMQTLVPYDSGRGDENRDIFDLEIDYWIKRLNRAGVTDLTLIFDCCHAGGLSRGADAETEVWSADRIRYHLQTLGSQDAAESLDRLVSGSRGRLPRGASGWISQPTRRATIIAACRHFEVSKEKIFDDHAEGVFTHFLTRALQRHPELRWDEIDWPRFLEEKIHTRAFERNSAQKPQAEVLGITSSDDLPELDRHAILIGISQYARTSLRLRTATNDAVALREVLISEQGYPSKNVHVLLDEEATGPAILELLDTLQSHKKIRRKSAILFYFAGHGETTSEGLSDIEGFLLPQDADLADRSTWTPMAKVRERLKNLHSRHLLVILDCCFAGAFSFSRRVERPRRLFRSQLQRYLESKAWQVLTSSTHNQLARDHGGRTLRGRQHSPFAAALIEGLAGQADVVVDGLITATELHQHIETELLDVPGGQIPVLSHFAPDSVGQFVFQVPGTRAVPLVDPELDEQNLPWRALAPYRGRHAPLFFGRERMIDALLPLLPLVPDSTSPRIVALVGASGCGKTSLLEAGLLPLLSHAGFEIIHPDRTSEADPLEDADLGPSAEPRPRLLIIDSLESLYTSSSVEERQRLISKLKAALDGGARALVALRSDYVTRFLDDYGGHVETRRVLDPTLDELRDIILRPAEDTAIFLEAELVDRLVEAVRDAPWPLATLSSALDSLYRHAFEARWKAQEMPDRELRLSDFAAIGEIAGGLQRRAEDLYSQADAEERANIRRLFLRLVSTVGGQRSKRRASRAELDFANARPVLQKFIGAHLLTVDSEWIEPVSNALLDGWFRIGAWLEDDSTRTIREAAWQQTQAWQASAQTTAERDPQLLWHRDPRLGVLETLAERRELNQLEMAFHRASEALRRSTLVKRLSRLAAPTAAQDFCHGALLAAEAVSFGIDRPRVTGSLQSVLAMTPLSLPLAIVGPVLGIAFANGGRQLRVRTLQHGLQPGQSRPVIQTFDLEESLRSAFDPNSEHPRMGQGDMVDSMPGGIALSKVRSPNGRWEARASLSDRAIHLTLENNRRLVLMGHQGFPAFLVFSPDGQWLASASVTHRASSSLQPSESLDASLRGELRLWRLIQDRDFPGSVDLPCEPTVIDAPSSSKARPGGGEFFKGLTFASDDFFLVAGVDSAPPRLWPFTALGASRTLPDVASHLPSEALCWEIHRTTDRTWAAAYLATEMRLFDLEHPTAPAHRFATPRLNPDTLEMISASRDGRTLLVRLRDPNTQGCWLWSPRQRPVRKWIPGITLGVLSPNGQRLFARVVKSHRAVLGSFPVGNGGSAFELTAPDLDPEDIEHLTISPDGTWLVARSSDGRHYFWTLDDGSAIRCPWDGRGTQCEAAFSQDGHWMAWGGDQGELILIDLHTSRSQESLHITLQAHFPEAISCLAFSANGGHFAAGSVDGRTRLWHLEDLEAAPIAVHRLQDPTRFWTPVREVALNSDGSRLAILLGHFDNPNQEKILVHRLDIEDLAGLARAVTGRELTADEWEESVGPESRPAADERSLASSTRNLRLWLGLERDAGAQPLGGAVTQVLRNNPRTRVMKARSQRA